MTNTSEKLFINIAEIDNFTAQQEISNHTSVSFEDCNINSFKDFFISYPDTIYLSIKGGSFNLKDLIESYVYSESKNLKHVKLENTKIISESYLTDLSNLQSLSTLALINISSSLKRLKLPNNLTGFYLENTDCSFLDFTELKSLKILTLKDNNLKVIRIENLSELYSIFIKEANLKYLEFSDLNSLNNLLLQNIIAEEIFIKNLESLKSISVQNNKNLTRINLYNTSELFVIYSSNSVKFIEHNDAELEFIDNPSCIFIKKHREALKGKVILHFTNNIFKRLELLMKKLYCFINIKTNR